MRYVLLLAFTVAFVASLVLTALARKLALRIGLVDHPGGRKGHEKPTPFGGGLAIVLSSWLVIGGAAAAAALWRHNPSLLPVPDSFAPDVEKAAEKLHQVLMILGAGSVLALFGLWDDARPRGPWTKFVVQFGVAIAVVNWGGLQISPLPPIVPGLQGTALAGWLQGAIAVLWIVVLANSFNLMDNMDGLCGTVAFVCAGALLILGLQTGQYFIGGFMVVLMGALLGFLCFNFPPASVFMGDMGSMFVGYMLATGTILATFVREGQFNPFFPVAVPLIIFVVPLYDSLSVAAIRLHHRRPLLKGDQNHFSHRIRRLGMNTRRVLLTVGLLTLATSLGATVPYGSPSWSAVVPAIQALCVVLVITQLELVSARIEHPD